MGSILFMHLLQVVQVMEEFILFIMINLGMLLKNKSFNESDFLNVDSIKCCKQYRSMVQEIE